MSLVPIGAQAQPSLVPQVQVDDCGSSGQRRHRAPEPAHQFVVKRRYVFGVFIHGAPHDPDDLFTAEYTSGLAQDDTFKALFRGELKAALDTWL